MNMPSVTVQVNGGLVSRMRVVVSAIAYSIKTGRQLILNWPLTEPSEKTGRFPVSFGELWEYPCEERNVRLHAMNKSAEGLYGNGDTEIRTCHVEPFKTWTGIDFRPWISKLTRTAMLNSVCDCIGNVDDALGMNIRMAHKQPDTVDLNWWHNRLACLNYTGRVFLATDHDAAYNSIKALFGDMVVAFDRIVGPYEKGWYLYDRDSIIKQAAELYVLSRCDYVIGSNHSSMSQMVAFMRGATWQRPHSTRECLGNLLEAKYEDAWNQP